MAGRYDAFITMDKSIPHQQRIDTRPFAVVILRARTNRLADLVPLVPALLATLDTIGNGQVVEIDQATSANA
jgi:hypothetical protein